MIAPDVLLWDFGDTLVDERWMLRPPPECPGWEAAWLAVMDGQAEDWNVGRVATEAIYAALADRTGMALASVRAHAHRCCQMLELNQTAWRVARGRLRPQALVTVNPDIVAELIVPRYALDTVFDVIVTSSGERTTDKSALCDTALRRLGGDRERRSAMLIDNRSDLVQAWQDLGGAGYCFTDDATFRADLPALGLAP